VNRYELDPAPRNAIFAAQKKTRANEGTSSDMLVAM
jgi:hypothetical protein